MKDDAVFILWTVVFVGGGIYVAYVQPWLDEWRARREHLRQEADERLWEAELTAPTNKETT